MDNINCDSCDSCYYCNSCDYCDSCDYCGNLRMTEYNYFCWSKEYNDENSFQQKRYRIFNVEVSKEEYEDAEKLYRRLEIDNQESSSTRFHTAFKKMWSTLTQEEKQEYFNIPHFNWEGFTFITGVEKEEVLVEVDGKKYLKSDILKLTPQ